MQGGSHNGLELTHELAEYFGTQPQQTQVVTIQLAPGVHFIRPFVYRGDDYGHWTDRWRLWLPTEMMGGAVYANRVIRFDRIQVGGVTVFQVTVTDVGSPDHVTWRNQSVPPHGDSGMTLGDREFGYWS
jgi:hypothetical protein